MPNMRKKKTLRTPDSRCLELIDAVCESGLDGKWEELVNFPSDWRRAAPLNKIELSVVALF
jgi:hypothetical protein